MLRVTSSWDDGDILDERLAQLLDRYGIVGTFYLSKTYREHALSEDAIRTIAQTHEIGAHTLTHPDLPRCTTEEKVHEIRGSKEWLEQVVGKPVTMFCYPRGLVDAETEKVVEEANFLGARDTQAGSISHPVNPYRMSTTLQVYPMPFRKLDATSYWWGKLLQPYLERSPALRAIGVPTKSFRSFAALARASFDAAQARGEVFHLWGHSWEIEKYGLWSELEAVLAYIGNRSDCAYVPNSALLAKNNI